MAEKSYDFLASACKIVACEGHILASLQQYLCMGGGLMWVLVSGGLMGLSLRCHQTQVMCTGNLIHMM